jgi:hypothetical protein
MHMSGAASEAAQNTPPRQAPAVTENAIRPFSVTTGTRLNRGADRPSNLIRHGVSHT